MKTLSKIENIVATNVMGFILWLSSAIGMWELLYECSFLDMGYDEAMWIWIPYCIWLTYWIIKKIVFRIIRIVKG